MKSSLLTRSNFVCSDNSGEFISDKITFNKSKEGFEMQPSVAHAHNQSGVVERAIQDVTTHTISILYEAGLPEKLWYEVAKTVIYLKNLRPHKFLQDRTPFETIEGRLPDIAHIRVIGSKAWAVIPKPPMLNWSTTTSTLLK